MSRRRAPRWVLLGLVILVGANLRPAVISISPLLDDIRSDLGVNATAAGVLTALPVLCFAAFGAIAPAVTRRLGPRLAVGGAMTVMAGCLVVRALAHNAVVFFVASGIALAGLALGNVIVPSLIRTHFPDRIGPVTGLFAMGLSLGTAGAAASTVPAADAIGHGWRAGLALWAIVALVAAVPWLLLWPSGGRATSAGFAHRGPRVHTSRTARTLALFFGVQALGGYAIMSWMPQIYRDAGLSPAHAGLLLALTTGLSIPIALLLPTMAVRMPQQGPLVVGLTALVGAGYAGLAFAPAHVSWLWALLIGVGNGCFPLAITMISMRARRPEYTATLSGFVQSVGYLLAAVGPLATGGLYQLTHAWYLPLGMLAGFLLVQGGAGYLAGRPQFIEDDLTGPQAGVGTESRAGARADADAGVPAVVVPAVGLGGTGGSHRP